VSKNATEHARSEPPLRNWEEALQTAKTPRSCLRCSSDLRYRFVSRACAQMFGREPKDFREILHAAVTPYPTGEWAAQRIAEWCARDLWTPRFLIHDRDSHNGATFECRLRHVGIEQVRTPFRAPPDRQSAGRYSALRMRTSEPRIVVVVMRTSGSGVLPVEWVSPAGRFVLARQTPLL
jgi:hypothetical protein